MSEFEKYLIEAMQKQEARVESRQIAVKKLTDATTVSVDLARRDLAAAKRVLATMNQALIAYRKFLPKGKAK